MATFLNYVSMCIQAGGAGGHDLTSAPTLVLFELHEHEQKLWLSLGLGLIDCHSDLFIGLWVRVCVGGTL